MCLDRRDFLQIGLPCLERLVPAFTAAAEDAAMLACMSDVAAQMKQGIGQYGRYGRCTEDTGNC